jgi:hypothetical protein
VLPLCSSDLSIVAAAISCRTLDSCKRTTKCKCVDFCINHQLLRQSRILQLTAVPCGYLRLPAATCGYPRPRQLLFLLLNRPNIEIALQNSCLCLKNLLMSRAISVTQYSNQVYCCRLLCSSDASLIICFPGQMFCSSDASLV